jgi:hypothetical protein
MHRRKKNAPRGLHDHGEVSTHRDRVAASARISYLEYTLPSQASQHWRSHLFPPLVCFCFCLLAMSASLAADVGEVVVVKLNAIQDTLQQAQKSRIVRFVPVMCDSSALGAYA